MIATMDKDDDKSPTKDSTSFDPLVPPAPFYKCHDDGNEDNEDCEDDSSNPMAEIDMEALEVPVGADRDEPSARDIKRNRALMTVFHFVLTYPRWSISLFLLFASWTTPLPTAQEQVTQPFRDLQAVIHSEAKIYEDCVERSFSFQDKQMERVAVAEKLRVMSILNANQLEKMAQYTDQCSNATMEVQRNLKVWLDLGLALPNRTVKNSAVTSCTYDDRVRLDKFLGSDLTNINKNIHSILDAYIFQSLEALRRVVHYSQDRGEYDYEYFVGVKIAAIMAVLDGFTIIPLSLTLTAQKIALELRNILQDLLNALQGAYVRIDLLAVRIAEFEVSLHAFYINYMDLYGRFALIRKFVRDFLPSGIPLPDYFDISGMPLPSALLPPIFQIPPFDGVLPDIDDLVSEYIIKAIKLMAMVLEEAAIEASEQTRQMIEELLELLRKLMQLEDYAPPKYPRLPGVQDTADEVARLQGLADRALTDTDTSLQDLNGLYANISEPVPPSRVDLNTQIIRSSYPKQFTFLDLSFPKIKIPMWIRAVFEYFASLSFLMECIVQAVRFYRLKRKYERKAAPDLPDIDYVQEAKNEDDGKSRSDENGSSKLQLAQSMLLKNAMNPIVIAALIFVPFVMSILIFWFPHVKATCIDSRQGTFLARRVFTPLQVNKASLQAFTLRAVYQAQCHRKQQVICGQQSTETSASFRNQEVARVSLQARFNESTEVFGVVDRCVDTEKLDFDFNSNCCGLEGYMQDGTVCPIDQSREWCPIDKTMFPPSAFRLLGETLSNSACQTNPILFSFEEATFNCSVLEEFCSRDPCTGVNADLIQELTIEADCSAEIHMIQLSLFLALTFFHAFLINFWNVFLFNGVMHTRWRRLKPDGIKLTTHVTAGGDLVKGVDVQERTERVEEVLGRFEVAGWMQLVLSAGIFVIWVFFFVLTKTIASRFAMYHK